MSSVPIFVGIKVQYAACASASLAEDSCFPTGDFFLFAPDRLPNLDSRGFGVEFQLSHL